MFAIGRSTTAQLISRAQNMNEYNNSAVANDGVWIAHFNSALGKMAEDVKINESTTINFVYGTEEYDLPDDYYAFITLNDSTNRRIGKRSNYDQEYPRGYWIVNKGANFVMSLKGFSSDEALALNYYRYPELLTEADKATQKPEVPTAAEDALVFLAIANALRNNNQIGQAQDFEKLYRDEVARMNTANTRARG